MKAKALTTVQLGIRLVDASIRFDMVRTLRRTGYATDGRFLFRPDPALPKKKIVGTMTQTAIICVAKPVPLTRFDRTS